MAYRLRKTEALLAAGALAVLGMAAVTAGAAADTNVNDVTFYFPGTLDYVTNVAGGFNPCGDVGYQQLPVLKRIDTAKDDPEGGGVDLYGGPGDQTNEGNYPDAQLVKFTPTNDLGPGATVTITMPHPVEQYAPSGEVLPDATVPKSTLAPNQVETGTTMSDPVFVPAGADPSDTDAHWDVTVTPPSGTSAQVDLDLLDAYDPVAGTSANDQTDSNTVSGAHPSVTFHISDSADANEDVLIEAKVGGVPVDQTKDIKFGSPVVPEDACQGYNGDNESPTGSADNGFSYAFIYNGYAFPLPDADVSLSSASNQATASLRVPEGVTFDHGTDLYVVALGAVSPPGGTYPAGAFSVSTSADPIPESPSKDITYAANLNVDGNTGADVGASSLAVSPTRAQVSDNGGPTATATVNDKYHNPIKDKTVEMFQGTATHAQFTPLVPPSDGALPQSGADGTVAYTVTDTCAETVDARAFDVDDSDLKSSDNLQGNVQLGSDQLVTFTAAPPVQPSLSVANPECGGNQVSSIQVDSATAPADGQGVDTVTITLVDRFGNPDARHAVVLSPSSTSTTGTHASASPAAGYAGTLCGTVADEGCSDSNGVVKFEITDTTAETVNLGVTDTTAAVTWPAGGSADPRDYAQVTFEPVDANASTVVANPTTAPADGAHASIVTVTLKDATGQPFAGRLVAVAPDPATAPSGDTSVVTAVAPAANSTTEARTGADGTAQFYVADDTANEDVDYQATVLLDDLVVTQRATIHWVTGGASLSASTGNVVADGSDGSVLTFRLRAPGGAPLVDEPVTLTSKPAGGTTSTVGTSTTDGNGEALFVVTGTTPGTVSYTATSTFATTDQCPSVPFDGATCTVTAGPVNITFVPKPASFTLTASPAQVPADGTSISQLSVQALDADGHPINGLPVRLVATGITAATTGGPTTNPADGLAPVTTGLDGTATFAVKSADAEKVTFDAQYLSTSYTISAGSAIAHPAWTASGGADSTVSVKFAMTEAQASTITAAPGTAIADGSSTITVTVSLCTVAICGDPSGLAEPISGHPVLLRGGSGSTTITPTSSPAGSTDGTGTVTFAVTDIQPETLTLYAQDAETGVITRAHVSITFEKTESDASTVTAAPSAVPAGGPTTTVTVTLRQWDGTEYAPIAGHQVTLHTGSTTTHVAPSSASTDSGGVATFTVWDSAVETVHLTASDGGTRLSSSVTVQFVATESNQSSLVANPASTPAQGAPITLTVTLVDGNGQPLTGHQVSIGNTTPTTTVAPLLTGGYTDSYGRAQFAVRDSAVEIETVTATDTSASPAVQLVQRATLSFITDEANQSSIAASPAVLPAGGPTTTVTVTLHDAGGYPLTGHQVALSSPSSTVSGTPTLATTDGAGQAQFTVTDPAVDAAVLTATDRTTGAVVDQTVTVTFVPDEANQSTATASTNLQVVRKDVTVTVVLLDANGNPISGHTVTLATGSGNAVYCPVGWSKPCKQSVNATTDATGTVRYVLTDPTPERLAIRVADATTGVTLYATLIVTFAK
ncbi:MAG TPA: Ig-like domain-containing protein [Jatrophihabitantaceae bacterium]|nr:Ig-like domain-containing protein [Jatrophihabitantaceae bacterium]